MMRERRIPRLDRCWGVCSRAMAAVGLTRCWWQERRCRAAAPINSPGFAGTPTAPTPSTSDNSTKIATTAYVQAQGFVPSDSTPWFTQPSATGTVSFLTTANTVKLFGVVYPGSTALVTTKVNYNVVTADNTGNTYDIGILNSSGQVVAHIGATAGTTFAASTGWKTLNWTGSATLTRGKYYLAITTNCTTSCAQIIGSSTGVGLTFVGGIQESVSSGGFVGDDHDSSGRLHGYYYSYLGGAVRWGIFSS